MLADQTINTMQMTPLEQKTADILLERLQTATVGQDAQAFAEAYRLLHSAVGYRQESNYGECGQVTTPCNHNPEVSLVLPGVDPPAETPTTPAKATRKPKATAEPTPPAEDPLAADPLAPEPAPAAPAATGKTYAERQAELKACYINKLRVLSEANTKEGDAFKALVKAEMDRIGSTKVSDPGEDKMDAFYSFVVNCGGKPAAVDPEI